jgi:hypothetical protein
VSGHVIREDPAHLPPPYGKGIGLTTNHPGSFGLVKAQIKTLLLFDVSNNQYVEIK